MALASTTQDKVLHGGGAPAPYYVDTAFILNAQDVSGQDWEWKTIDDKWRGVHRAIVLTLDIGADFQPSLYIGGLLKGTADHITGWGSAFVVDHLVQGSGFPGDTLHQSGPEEDAIQAAALEHLIGQQIARLRYVYRKQTDPATGSDRLKYADYNRVVFVHNEANADAATEKLEKIFNAEVKRGYPKDYRPALIEPAPAPNGSDPGFHHGSPTGPAFDAAAYRSAADRSGQASSDHEVFIPDDEIPF